MNVLRLFQGTLKHIKSLSKKVCFVVVVVAASRAEGGLVFFTKIYLDYEILNNMYSIVNLGNKLFHFNLLSLNWAFLIFNTFREEL